ncbi:MAG: hypothetical protein AB7J35_09965 [Dehalococcoidia bacterium]
MTVSRDFTVFVEAKNPIPERSYRVEVLDEAGNPVPGAEVTVALIDWFGAFERGSREPRELHLRTGDDGSITFDWYEFPDYKDRKDYSSQLLLIASASGATSIDVGPETFEPQGWV